MNQATKTLLGVLMATVASLSMVACGGGSGPKKSLTAFKMVSVPSYGVMGANPQLRSFVVLPPTPSAPVLANDFSSASGGDVNFVEIPFSATVMATSLTGNGVGGSAGLVIRSSTGATVPYFLDSIGAIDPSNAFPAPGVAPKTLRVYFEAPANPGTPIALAPDKYTVALIPSNLRSGEGAAFCQLEGQSLCLNPSDVVYHFTLDGMNSPGGNVAFGLGPKGSTPPPTIMQVGDEIGIFFSDQVDFQSIVGFDTANGRPNSTTLDPFCSLPFALNAVATGANIQVILSQPAPQVLPSNYGYIVYMPNPFQDATEVRIRFVDLTATSGINDPAGATTGGTPTFQNYAIPSAVWQSAPLASSPIAAPTDGNPSSITFGMPLELPTRLSLPGSNSTGTRSIALTLFSPANAGASDSSAGSLAPDGVMGVTDRARRSLGQDVVVTRTLGSGPVVTNNPEVPDLHLIANGRILDGIDMAGVTVDGQGASTLTGAGFPIAQKFDDMNTLLSIRDIQFGAFINPVNMANNPPRRLNHAAILAQKQLAPNDPTVLSPGVPFPPGGTPEASVLSPTGPPPSPPPPAQPLGLRLYVVDDQRGVVQVLNSSTFQPLGIVSGLSSPRGLGVGGTFLYASNFDTNSISRIGINPVQTATFHTVVSTTPVGPGPTAVSVQPGNEDVVVINSLANSISFVDVPSFQERIQLPVGLGPREVMVSGRWNAPGATIAYQAYVTNQFSNTVTVYESDTPIVSEMNGPDGKIITSFGGFQSPLYGCSNLFVGAANGIGAQGALVANSQGTTITYMGMTSFGLAPPIGFPGPPSFRTFNTIIDYASNSPTAPTDCAIESFTAVTSGALRVLLVVYPATGQVAVIDFNNGTYYGGIAVPGTQIFGFLDQ